METTKGANMQKKWEVTMRHIVTKEERTVIMPGGLHEAEAARGACLKLNGMANLPMWQKTKPPVLITK